MTFTTKHIYEYIQTLSDTNNIRLYGSNSTTELGEVKMFYAQVHILLLYAPVQITSCILKWSVLELWSKPDF